MSETQSLPSERPLKRPYFLLRAPDGRNHYFRYEIVRAIFHSSDPISRFLPRGEVVGKPDARSASTGQDPALKYDFSELELLDPAPLKYLSDAEIEGFAQAVDAFLLRGGDAPSVSSYERELRERFLLPDPSKEPDAYWTYGPSKQRKLLVLHGVEYEPNTSIKPDEVVAYLKANCRLPWGMAQDQVIERLQETGEPLSRIVARPSGNGYAVAGRHIAADAVKPLKRFPPKLAQAFRDAAIDFYQRARPENCPDADEQEWRRQFKLPDPLRSPEAFLVAKDAAPGLLIVLSDREEEANCLALCADPALPETMPPRENLADRLDALKPKVGFKIGAAAAAVAVLALGLYALFGRDTEGPRLVSDFGDNGVFAQDLDQESDPFTLVVQFDEPIDPASIASDTVESKLQVRDNRTNALWPLAAPPEVFGEKGDRIRLTLAKRMTEGDRYQLLVNPVADSLGNLSETIETRFEYIDELPPALDPAKPPTSEGNGFSQVRFFFTDTLDQRSAADTRNFHIEPVPRPGVDQDLIEALTIESARMNDDGQSITVRVSGVDTPFEHAREYRVRISGVEDSAGNEIERDRPLEIRFAYLDTLPPTPVEAKANNTQFELSVDFDERVNPDLSRIADYLAIEAGGGREVGILSARLDESGQKLLVETETALRSGVEYVAALQDVPDTAPTPNVMSEPARLAFTFDGSADLQGPQLKAASALFNRVTLTYSEPIDERVTNPDHFGRFKLTDEDGNDYEFQKATIREGDPSQLRLESKLNIPEDVLLEIETPGVIDRARNPGRLEDLRLKFASQTMTGRIELQQAVYEPSSSHIRIKFNRRPHPEALQRPEWFRFQPPMTVENVSVASSNPRELLLEVSGIEKDASYSLSIDSELTALDGTPPASTLATSFNGPASTSSP